MAVFFAEFSSLSKTTSMKIRNIFLLVATVLLIASCQKPEDSPVVQLQADPFEDYPFVKHVSIADFAGDNSVVLKIGAQSQEELDAYRPEDYILIPEYEHASEQASISSSNGGTASQAASQPEGVLIKMVVDNLMDGVYTFRIQPRDMEVNTTGKNNSAPYSFEVRDQYMAAWCVSGSYYAYYYVDNTYKYAIFMKPGQASYGLDYNQPYVQRVDLYLYEDPASVLIYDKGVQTLYALD